MKARRVAAVGLLALVGAWSSPAAAFVCTAGETNTFVSIHWDIRTIPVAVRSGASTTIPAEALDRIIRESFAAWSGRSCSDVSFVFGPVVPDDPPYDNLLCMGLRETKEKVVELNRQAKLDQISQVVMVHDCWPHDDGILALTTMTFGSRDGVIRFGVIEVNERRPPSTSGYVFGEVDEPAACLAEDGDVYDFGAVMTHEVGHFLGLAHTDVVGGRPGDRPTMTATVQECDPDFRSLSADDVDGLCYIYPAQLGARQCLPLPDQEEPYIESAPFGCASAPGDAAAGLPLIFVAWAALRRRTPRPRPCPAARSRR